MAGFNPMYNNAYGGMYSTQPVANPMLGYQERMAQLQQQYNVTQPMQQYMQQPMNSLMGKVVDSLEVVRATDIPMDGNCYYFPKADGTEVYVKRWLANGTTEVMTYKPSLEEARVETPTIDMQALYDKLDGIEGRIEKIEKNVSNRSIVRANKKEEAE